MLRAAGIYPDGPCPAWQGSVSNSDKGKRIFLNLYPESNT